MEWLLYSWPSGFKPFKYASLLPVGEYCQKILYLKIRCKKIFSGEKNGIIKDVGVG